MMHHAFFPTGLGTHALLETLSSVYLNLTSALNMDCKIQH